MERTAIAVVGAGPAGATAAVHLAGRGHEVLLIDRHRFPRDKACGDGLIPDALEALRRVGLYDEVKRRGRAMREAAIFSPARYEFRVAGDFVVLKRLELDDLLVRTALERGARFRRGRVVRIQPDAEGVRVETTDGEAILAEFAVVATGADVSLLREFGAVRQAEPSGVAIRRYVTSRLELDHLVVSYDRSIIPGYAWIFPTGPHEFNVGCGVSYSRRAAANVELRAALDIFLAEFPLGRELMASADEPGAVRGARLRCGLGGVAPLIGGRVLVAGETLAATFPFTGEGIGKAMETAEAAAEVLDQALGRRGPAALREYAAMIEALRPKYRGYELAERWLASSVLNDLVARRAARSRYMQEAFAGIITETIDPAQVFSFRSLLRSLVG